MKRKRCIFIQHLLLNLIGCLNKGFLVSADTDNVQNCTYPSVPFGSTYVNISGGPQEPSWFIKYSCDSGLELFGNEERRCNDGKWTSESLPECAFNVALHKPAFSSSYESGGSANNAVDGLLSTLHEGKQCTVTQKEPSPWWTVDLLSVYSVKYVRIHTRCCDNILIQNAEIRVGNSTEHTNNPLCNWIPKALKEGSSETLDCDSTGRYVSLSMTGSQSSLSFCEFQVFSFGSPPQNCDGSESTDVFDSQCYTLLPDKDIAGFEEANQRCKSLHSSLSLIHHLTESRLDFLTNRLHNNDESQERILAWIGALRSLDNEWNWTTQTKVETIPWGKDQPNNYNQEQNCAVLDSDLDWNWNDISCRISAKVICQGPLRRCSSPPVTQGSFVEKLDSSSYLVYGCPLGSKILGESEQNCTHGIWSGGPVSCKAIDCGQVPGLLNGEIHFIDGRTSYGARVKYACSQDYSLSTVGDALRTCEEFGWSGQAPSCIYTKCETPKDVPNSYLKEVFSSIPYGLDSKLIYTCHTGYKAIGSLSRTCLLGGKWSDEEPICQFIDCFDPPSLKDARFTLVDGRTTFGAEVSYSCLPNYRASSLNTKRRCESDGNWTPNSFACDLIICPIPAIPNGGLVSEELRNIGDSIFYTCLPGHILIGNTNATCNSNGEWSQEAPSCKFIDCGSVPSLSKGSVFYVNGSTHLGSYVTYTCDSGFSLDGDASRHCEENGTWNLQPPICSEIRCQLPPRNNNTVISVSSAERLHGTSVIRSKSNTSYRVGSTLKYRCERGFILKLEDGSNARVITRRCTRSETWTGIDPTCEYIDCGLPESPENSVYTLANNGTYFGSIVYYSCKPNFILTGFEKRQCEFNGNWMPEVPKCTETLCKELKAPENGTLTLTTLRIGGRAIFDCHPGFSLKGSEDIECLSSGSWSGWPPTCLQIDCGTPLDIENGRIFLTNDSTTIGSIVEYHCFPGFQRSGLFQRICGSDGYWSGAEPSCFKPNVVHTPLKEDKNVKADNESEPSNVGIIIGIVLGLIVVIGLLVLGVYFYKKQKSILNHKPAAPPFRDRMTNPITSYTASGALYGQPIISAVVPPTNSQTSSLGNRQPPPIQMYSMEESNSGDDLRGPIYDTIRDDSSGSSGYSRNNGNSSTFTPTINGIRSNNLGYINDYDIPEGSEHSRPQSSVGNVTINGIAV